MNVQLSNWNHKKQNCNNNENVRPWKICFKCFDGDKLIRSVNEWYNLSTIFDDVAFINRYP